MADKIFEKNPAISTKTKSHPLRARSDFQMIIPNLLFNDKAEEAAHFYVSIFSDNDEAVAKGRSSGIHAITRYGEAGARVAGTLRDAVMTVEFRLSGQEFIALNAGRQFKFTEAMSLAVNCETQKEIDYFWKKLSEGGEEGVCGWLKDRYGLSWQIVPFNLDRLLRNDDPEKVERVMEAFLKMKKIDVQVLKDAGETIDKNIAVV